MKNCIAIKKGELLIQAMSWVNLTGIILSGGKIPFPKEHILPNYIFMKFKRLYN